MTDQQETIKDMIDNIISLIASPQSDTVLEQIIDNLIKDLEEENKSILNKGTDIMWTNTINTLKETKPTFITIDEGEENRKSLYSIYSNNQDDEDLIIFLTTMETGEDYQNPTTGITYIKIPSWISQNLPTIPEDDFTCV